jgi:chemotaxis protein CheX
MICGDARRILAEQGHQFQAAIPAVIDGKGHKICHPFPGPVLVIPFAVGEAGKCVLEVCLTESDRRRVLTPKPPRLPNSLVGQEPEK